MYKRLLQIAEQIVKIVGLVYATTFIIRQEGIPSIIQIN